MLNILNKLTLQKKLQKFVTHNVLLDKKTQQQNNQTKNLQVPGIEPGTSRSGCVTSAPQSQLSETFVVKAHVCI